MQFKASAPGSLLLLGEYGVLHGEMALVVALDQRINVLLKPRADQSIMITSHMGTYTVADKRCLIVEPPLQFVLAAIKHYEQHLPSGCELEIQADRAEQIGLGSSAAVTVATVTVLRAWLNKKTAARQLLQEACAIIRAVQGVASGADVAAAVYGGVVAYRAEPLQVKKYPLTYPLTVLYSGVKIPTTQVIADVRQRFAQHLAHFQTICRHIGKYAQDGIQAVRCSDWHLLGIIMAQQQRLLLELGVSTPLLHAIQTNLQQTPGILGAKISGAGLGDCVVGLGQAPDISWQHVLRQSGIPLQQIERVRYIPVAMSLLGAL